ncbi:MAG: ABC transporter, permease protein 1 (cluster 1, maltose/g3p/polyamine/iron), partial [uncultured Friedmanniella sp.]
DRRPRRTRPPPARGPPRAAGPHPAAEPQPLVLGVRRTVPAGPAGLRLRADPVERLPLVLRRPQHRHPDPVRRAGQLRLPAAGPRLRLEHGDVLGLRGLHRAGDLRLLAGAGPARQPGAGGAGVLPLGVLPAHRLLLRHRRDDLAAVVLQRGAVRPGQLSSPLAGVRERQLAERRELRLLGGAGQPPAVAAGRVLHDPVPRGPAADPDRHLRGGRDRRRGGLEGLPLDHPAAAAGHLGGGRAAAAHRRVPGLRRVLQHPHLRRRLPAVRPAPAGVPLPDLPRRRQPGPRPGQRGHDHPHGGGRGHRRGPAQDLLRRRQGGPGV